MADGTTDNSAADSDDICVCVGKCPACRRKPRGRILPVQDRGAWVESMPLHPSWVRPVIIRGAWAESASPAQVIA